MTWIGLGAIIFGLWSFITGRNDRKKMEARQYYVDYPGLKRIDRAMINRKVHGGMLLVIGGIIILIKFL